MTAGLPPPQGGVHQEARGEGQRHHATRQLGPVPGEPEQPLPRVRLDAAVGARRGAGQVPRAAPGPQPEPAARPAARRRGAPAPRAAAAAGQRGAGAPRRHSAGRHDAPRAHGRAAAGGPRGGPGGPGRDGQVRRDAGGLSSLGGRGPVRDQARAASLMSLVVCFFPWGLWGLSFFISCLKRRLWEETREGRGFKWWFWRFFILFILYLIFPGQLLFRALQGG